MRFLNTKNAISKTTSSVFHHFWLRYHNLKFRSTCVNNIRANSEWIRAESELNQPWISAENPMFQSSEEWALNSAASELILSETALNFSVLDSAYSDKIRADQLWNSAIQRQLSLGFQLGLCFSFDMVKGTILFRSANNLLQQQQPNVKLLSRKPTEWDSRQYRKSTNSNGENQHSHR